jgi:single-stranded DNA-binding protein
MSAIEAAMFGTLARDAERKTSQKGKSYLRFTLKIGDGDAVTWVSVMSFDAEALTVADKMVAGARVYVEGRLSLDEWTGQDGAKRHGLNVMSFHTRLAAIGRNKPKRESPEPNNAAGSGVYDDDLPF